MLLSYCFRSSRGSRFRLCSGRGLYRSNSLALLLTLCLSGLFLRAKGFRALLHFGRLAGDTAGYPLSCYRFVNGRLGTIGRKCRILRASSFFSTLLKSGILKCWHLVVGTFS